MQTHTISSYLSNKLSAKTWIMDYLMSVLSFLFEEIMDLSQTCNLLKMPGEGEKRQGDNRERFCISYFIYI